MTVYRANASGVWQSAFQKIGSGPGEIASIGGMQFDKSGALWISDTRNSRASVRSADTKLMREFKTPTSLRALAPLANGAILALASSMKDLAVVLDNTGALTATVPYPKDVEALNPILRKRFLVRINDSLGVLQFRWCSRRIAIRNDGRILYDSGSIANGPHVVAMKLDDKGSVGYRIASKQTPFWLGVAARGDTLYMLLGSKNESEHGRYVARMLASTGRALDRIALDQPVQMIAATRQGLFGIRETDNGYSLYAIRIGR